MDTSASSPCIVLVGVTGTGKSTVLEMLETRFCAKRVLRVTTRLPRHDDDSRFVRCVTKLQPCAGDFVYYGWNNSIYCVAECDVASVRADGDSPLVELGSAQDGLAFASRFVPSKVVWVKRPQSEQGILETMVGRGASEVATRERMESFEEDLAELASNVARFDAVIENDGSIRHLRAQVESLAFSLQLIERIK